MGGTLLDSYMETVDIGVGENSVPHLDATASQAEDGRIHITLCNTSVSEGADVECVITGTGSRHCTARILTGEMDAHNDFETLERVKVEEFDAKTHGQRRCISPAGLQCPGDHCQIKGDMNGRDDVPPLPDA